MKRNETFLEFYAAPFFGDLLLVVNPLYAVFTCT